MLFDNNNYFDIIFNISDDKKSATIDNEGFFRGNMFINEYKPYKNYSYIMPKVNNEKESLLLKIMASSFAINDYNLYLDIHPDNKEILDKYRNETERLKNLSNEYEKKYGPLSIDTSNYSSFKWIESPWPWEKDGIKYV